MSARTAFVIGARGFVGAHVARALVATGWRIVAFGPAMEADRLADLGAAVTDVTGSIADAATLRAALADSGAEVVVSLAAFVSGSGGLARAGEDDAESAFAINVLGLRNTFEAARAAGLRRVIWASSTTLYGPAGHYAGPVDEDAPPRPQLTYGLTKAMAELLSDHERDRHGTEAVAVRLPLVFGPGLWYRGAAAALLDLLAAARPGARHILRGPEAPVDLMYAPDAGAAFATLCAHPGPLAGRYNVNGFTATYPQLCTRLRRLVPGFDPVFEPARPPVVYPLIRTDRIARDTGFAPRFDAEAALADHLRSLEAP